MADMDLSGQKQLNTAWSYDEGTDKITIDFTDSAANDLGTLTLDGKRFKSFVDALTQIGQVFFPSGLDLTTRVPHITHFNQQTGAATTEFDS